MYCVNCGKDEKLYEHLCKTCFLEKTKFFELPKVLKIMFCSNCNAWEKANHWEPSESEEDALNQRLMGELKSIGGAKVTSSELEWEPYKTNELKATLHLSAKFEDLDIKESVNTEVRIKYSTCGRCSRQAGSYFEAIIQIRATNRELDDPELERANNVVDEMLNNAKAQSVDSNAFLTKTEFIHGGQDFYIGSSTIARQIAKQLSNIFSGNLKESRSLAGRKDGREIYRITCTVRLPEYKQGDFMKVDNRIYKIVRLFPKRAQSFDLKTGQTRNLNHDELSKGDILGGDELVYDAVVLTNTKSEVQIMDPVNYKTVDLIKPKNFEVDGDSVKIFRDEEDIYLLPNTRKSKRDKN
jgi:nonsense-mediated mRNA decay protein 3